MRRKKVSDTKPSFIGDNNNFCNFSNALKKNTKYLFIKKNLKNTNIVYNNITYSYKKKF